jgi:hypothetical protein
VLLNGALPDPVAFGATAALSAGLLIVSALLFHSAEFTFAENI